MIRGQQNQLDKGGSPVVRVSSASAGISSAPGMMIMSSSLTSAGSLSPPTLTGPGSPPEMAAVGSMGSIGAGSVSSSVLAGVGSMIGGSLGVEEGATLPATMEIWECPRVQPPDGFAFVEEGIMRCRPFLSLAPHKAFLDGLHVKTLMNLTPRALPKGVEDFLEEGKVELVNALEGVRYFPPQANLPPEHDSNSPDLHPQQRISGMLGGMVDSMSLMSLGVGLSRGRMKTAVETLLNSTLHPILILATDEGTDGALIGCLRRVQHWSLVSILAEYRMFSGHGGAGGGYGYDENEQFIEKFDPDLVCPRFLPAPDTSDEKIAGLACDPEGLKGEEKATFIPSWLQLQLKMLEEEEECLRLTRGYPSNEGDPVNKGQLPAYRISSKCYWGPLVSSACTFSEKLSILGEDDDA